MIPPTNKIVLNLNGWLIDNYLSDFAAQMLPNYDYKVTSGYRTAEDQARLEAEGYSPAKDSAHLYNLARDIVLVNKATGTISTDEEMETIFNKFIEPAWIGFTYFQPALPGHETGHIHLNIERTLTAKTQLVAFAGSALVVGIAIKNLFFNKKRT